jgi:hypothetical protein
VSDGHIERLIERIDVLERLCHLGPLTRHAADVYLYVLSNLRKGTNVEQWLCDNCGNDWREHTAPIVNRVIIEDIPDEDD